MNKIILSGKMVADFKVSNVGDKVVAKGTLAVERKMSKAKKEEAKAKGYPTADFPQLEIWGSQAKIDLLTSHVNKGDKLTVDGYIKTGSYEKDGKKIYTTVVFVNDFEFEYKNTNNSSNFEDIDI